MSKHTYIVTALVPITARIESRDTDSAIRYFSELVRVVLDAYKIHITGELHSVDIKLDMVRQEKKNE